MHKKNGFVVCSFYKFIPLNRLETLKSKLFQFFKENNSKGTILISKEGINGSLSFKKEQTKNIKFFLEETCSTGFSFKIQNHSTHVFLRLKIKIKKEIIRLGEFHLAPKIKTGILVAPKKWDELINEENVTIIDTRNDYESEIGSFKNATKTNTNNFTEFPNWVKNNSSDLKKKKIAMFCTGGIRCEKASAFLLNNGYKKVYQLKGGIINYLKITKNKNQKWLGECFVFDERVSLQENLKKGDFFQCYACRSAITKKEMKSKFYKEGISCPKCFKLTSNEKKKNFAERQKQVKLAKKKGIKHLGS